VRYVMLPTILFIALSSTVSKWGIQRTSYLILD
jgi:hypothetical protein